MTAGSDSQGTATKAALIFWYNEDFTVAEVVQQFRAEIPDVEVYA
jgi:hypothetical protein